MPRLLIKIDGYILLGTYHVRKFLCEWASVTRRKLERAAVVIYLSGMTIWAMNNLRYHSSYWFLGIIFIGGIGRWFSDDSDAQRVHRMMSSFHSAYRIFLVASLVFDLGADAIVHMHWNFWYEWAFDTGWGMIVFYEYLSALPSDGDPGRKRKLAMDKIKEMFGTEWMPETVPQPL